MTSDEIYRLIGTSRDLRDWPSAATSILDSSSFGTLFLVKEFEASLYFWDVRFWGLWLSDLWQSAVVTFISRGFGRKMSNILLNAWMHSIL